MPEETLSTSDARKLALDAQGLLRATPFGRGLGAAARAVDQLGYVQIDTISVVNRAHHHVLQSRIPGFKPESYNRLLQRGDVFEYWFHAASYLPMVDYRYYQRAMAAARARWKVEPRMKREIIAAISAEGPLGSRFFEADEHRSRGWWDWKPAKRALELLYLQGELIVTARHGFQKIYDLAERALPPGLDTSFPDDEQWATFLIRRVLKAHGLATLRDITYLKQGARHLYPQDIRSPVIAALSALQESGETIAVKVAGETWYTTPATLAGLPLRSSKKAVRFLSPFDNVVINRRRAQALFDFDYTLECYVPEAKRQFGYFSLPMLLGTKFIGRMDAKAERKRRELTVRNLALEETAQATQATDAIVQGLQAFAASVDCESVRFEHAPPPLPSLPSAFV